MWLTCIDKILHCIISFESFKLEKAVEPNSRSYDIKTRETVSEIARKHKSHFVKSHENRKAHSKSSDLRIFLPFSRENTEKYHGSKKMYFQHGRHKISFFLEGFVDPDVASDFIGRFMGASVPDWLSQTIQG